MGGGGEGGVKKKRVPGNDADAPFELKRANKTQLFTLWSQLPRFSQGEIKSHADDYFF